jgi:hypothetical protein
MSKIIVFDHETHPTWAETFKTVHESVGRTNGAYTYAVDISKYHIPVIRKFFKDSETYKKILVVAVGGLEPDIMPKDVDLVIVYLHEHTDREIPRIERFKRWYHGKTIFVIANKERATMLTNMGHDAIFLPAAICVSDIEKYKTDDRYEDNRVVFFGNKYLKKFNYYDILGKEFKRRGWIFDTISGNKLNWVGEVLSRDQMFNLLAKYRYGIAVGRAALELGALGIKTMICAEKFGGIITNEKEFLQQLKTNFVNAAAPTFSESIRECIDNFHRGVPRTHDIKDSLKYLVDGLKQFA